VIFTVPEDKIVYGREPQDPSGYRREQDHRYARWAKLYDRAVKVLPVWKTWIGAAVALIEGPRVLEASFGTGYLLTRYAADYEVYGIDYNATMVQLARANLRRRNLSAVLQQADVENLPFADGFFDTVVNTMAFSGYPSADRAMAEFARVLRPGGKLILIDFDYPTDRNRLGYALVKLMENAGDTIRPIGEVLDRHGFDFTRAEIGGFGSVHLFVAHRLTST